MNNKEIRDHICTARFDISRAMKELKAINAHATWQDLLRINRRLEELATLFELEEQEEAE